MSKGDKEKKEFTSITEVKDFHGCQTNLLTVNKTGKTYRRICLNPEVDNKYYQVHLTVGKCKKILANIVAIKKFVEKFDENDSEN